MTEAELETFRLKAKIEAIHVLLRMLYTGLANSAPSGPQPYRDQFASLRREHGKIALKGLDPVTSDLIAAEYQEALDDLLTYIEAGFRS